jgi:RNA polymerase sigma-70 factor (ECF subfamily)
MALHEAAADAGRLDVEDRTRCNPPAEEMLPAGYPPQAAGDARLLEQIRSGDAEAGRSFVREHYPAIYRYLLYLTGQPELAEDLTQETFLQGWQHLGTFQGRASLRTWLHRIARREFLQVLRRQKTEASVEAMVEVAAPDATAWIDTVELRDAIDRLPLEQREVVLLYYLEGYSSTEIARIVGAPVGTVCYRLGRARERLRQELGEDDLTYLNEPTVPMRQWSWLPLEQMYALETRLSPGGVGNRKTPGQGTPTEETMERREFLRQAAVGAAGLMLPEAEKEVVDSRLTKKVTCAFKGTALSDLCERLRSDTGIQLTAGPSVADEKVTLFCEKLPLREVMRQLSRPFGYTWLRSGKPGEYRYELAQDLRSQLLEEELRNRDRHAALLSLEQELERFRPYLSLSPDQILARSRTAPPAEKLLLEKIGGSETRSALGWGPIQIYFRLSPQEKMALLAGEKLYFSEGPRPGERPLPSDVARGVMQGWREERALKAGDGHRMTNADEPGSIPISDVPGLRASVSVSLDQTELGQYGLNGLSGFYGPDPMNRRDASGPYAIGRSPRVMQPDNARANARLAKDPALLSQISIQPRHVCEGSLRQPTHDQPPKGNQEPASDAGLSSSIVARHVTTADVLEVLHQATGLPIIADYYTRFFKPESVSVRGQTLFAALNQLCDTMRLRWNKESRGGTAAGSGAGSRGRVPTQSEGVGAWLQFRSTSYYDDRLKEVPNRLLEHWAAVRRQHLGLRLDDLIEIAGLTDAQLGGAEMAEGAKECYGLAEWDLARHPLVLPGLRYLAGFTPEQRRKAEREEGLPFMEMSLAQQQGFLARRWPAKLVGTDTPNPATLPSLEDLSGSVLYIDYRQPGWYEWRPPGSYLLRWLVPVDPGPKGRLIPRPKVRERTREAALQALRRVDPQVRAAVLAAVGRSDPRLLAELVSDETQIVPTDLNLTLIYSPARQSVLVVSSDFWSVMGAW